MLGIAALTPTYALHAHQRALVGDPEILNELRNTTASAKLGVLPPPAAP